MQPYLFPYIGYFQLMNAVDEFVVYDNIEFSKGWVNRNRILVNGKDSFVTIPLKKDSDYLDVRERFLAENWDSEKKKIMNRLAESYRKAPFFKNAYPVIEQCVLYNEPNLFGFIFHSLNKLSEYLSIRSPLIVSSTVLIDHKLKGEEKVIAICKARKASAYFNPIGGVDLYKKSAFNNAGIELRFLKSNELNYKQFNNEFVPWLSIIDVMMFNSTEEVSAFLNSYSLIP
jgi:hypothetical protein